MQDDQGFDNNEKVELVEFSYRPLSIQHQLKPKPLPRSREYGHQFDNFLPTKDELRQQCSQSLIINEQQYIVFNNYNQSIGQSESQFIFNADFESSNLEIVIKRKYLDYELYLRPDTNTNSHFQWFYFKVKSIKPKKTVVFTIKNFLKSTMLYNEGLKPFFKSSKDSGSAYKQLSTQVKFYQLYNEQFSNLKFSYTFQFEGEQVYFCSQPPYSFCQAMEIVHSSRAQAHTLCKSLLGKKVPYLVYNDNKPTKAIVIAIARQHPGQTVGSWMMEGFINQLQRKVYDQICWYIFPMINVDGVILGNNRTGLAGLDYNRFWNIDQLNKRQKSLPQLVALVNILKTIRKKYPKKIKLFLDFHGHSSQPNVFSYGPPLQENNENYFLSRAFPELISRKNENFSIQQCSYMLKADKKNTSRNLTFNYFNIPFSYTIEGSFGILRGKNVDSSSFIQIGSDITQATNEFLLKYVLKEKNPDIINMVEVIKERYKNRREAQQYDSQTEQNHEVSKGQIEDIRNVGSISINSCELNKDIRPARSRVQTQTSTPFPKNKDEGSFHLFRNDNSNQRYAHSNRKRNQTQTTISHSNKISVFPKIKQSFASRNLLKVADSKKVENITNIPQCPSTMNICQIQKRLFRLRNSRIGKKILIINAYGV